MPKSLHKQFLFTSLHFSSKGLGLHLSCMSVFRVAKLCQACACLVFLLCPVRKASVKLSERPALHRVRNCCFQWNSDVWILWMLTSVIRIALPSAWPSLLHIYLVEISHTEILALARLKCQPGHLTMHHDVSSENSTKEHGKPVSVSLPLATLPCCSNDACFRRLTGGATKV